MEAWWISLATITLATIVYFVRITWALRGVHDVAHQALAKSENCVPRSECLLREKRNEDMLSRIDSTVGRIWKRLDELTDTDRLARVEAKVETLERQVNGNDK